MKEVLRPEDFQLYDIYKVEIQFRDRILGGIPKSREVIRGWLQGRLKEPRTREEVEKMVEKTSEEVYREEDISKEEERQWTSFKSDPEKGLYLEERQIKAGLREAASVLQLTRIAGFRDTINHGVFVRPDKLYFDKKEPDGAVESVGHGMGPRGPRTFLKRQDYLVKSKLSFHVLVTKPINPKKESPLPITQERLKTMFKLLQEIGLGAGRSQGYGKFDLLDFKEVEPK